MASFVPITYFGLLISIALLNTLLATLFILPSALIFWIGTERFFRKRLARKNGELQA
jgi:predicted RND superfamily exporter protein